MGLNRNSKEHLHKVHHDTYGKSGNWIAGAIKNKGSLHKELGVPEGKKIPKKKLDKAARSKNPLLKKRAKLAETLRSFKNKKNK
jgi:hypothetical protein